MLTLTNSCICLFVHHLGAIDHFEKFTQVFEENNISYTVHAKGPASTQLEKRKISFQAYDDPTKIKKGKIIVDISPQSIELLENLQNKNLEIIAFVDNPEKEVAGEYGNQLQKIKQLATKVFYANVNHPKKPNEFGIGYSPTLEKSEKIRASREKAKRSAFFEKHGLQDTGQKIVTFFGGANSYYYKHVIPLLSQILQNANQENVLFVLQQHPRAKDEGNVDWEALQNNAILSKMNSDEILTYTDVILYNQTSMSPIFCDLGIPTFQIGPEWNQDVFYQLGGKLMSCPEDFSIIHKPFQSFKKQKIYEEIGYDKHWQSNLLNALSK